MCRVAIGSSGSGVLHLLARDGAILDVDAVTECEVRWAANGLRVRVEMARSVRDPRRLELRQVTDSNGRVLYRWSECHQAADQPPGPASAAVVKAKARADAGAVAKAFYGAYRGMPPLGIPERKQLSKLLPYLSARLKQLLADAQRHQTAYAKQHPDDKPPFVDGDLFSSNFEGFSTFTIGDVQTEGSTFRVDVQLTYSDPQKPRDVTRWKDAAIVVRENGRFVIDDFDFKGDWPFATRGRLSEILRARD